jgi:hypothetical protein
MRWVVESGEAKFKETFHTFENLRAISERSIPLRKIMHKESNLNRFAALFAVMASCGTTASAFTFENESFSGSFDSTVASGIGIRAKSPSCGLVIQGASGGGAPEGCISPTSALGDQGNLNYRKGDVFTGYLKGSHELLLKFPDDIRFMARFNWITDPGAINTSGITSATTPPNVSNGLTHDAREDLKFKARLLDFWVSKSFQIGEQTVRVRAGNQVVSWGESLFLPGGINATNALDLQKLSQPGTQLKEVFLPAPMVSVATGLGGGVNAEAYVQSNWNASYFPPTGSYWSIVNGLGKGHGDYGLAEVKPNNSRLQWGASVRFQPDELPLNLGIYTQAFNDKSPNFSANVNGTGAVGWTYAKNRQLYGVSANFPVGDWAVGTELSFRPRDAVTLNSNVDGCAGTNGNCWVDEKRYQFHLTGLLSLTKSGTGSSILKVLGADTGTFLAEGVAVRYPSLKASYNGELISAGGWGWGQETSALGTPYAVGSKTSSGVNFDFSWVYDGTLVPGWQVIPEIYYFRALSGRTPNASALFMRGASSANFTVSFVQNPAKWQFAVNYAAFWGGNSVFDQPYRDRNFVGAVLSRNF